MKGLLLLICLISLPAFAQQIPSEIDALTRWQLVEASRDTLGYAVFVSAPDSLEVLYNVRGEPNSWRAVIGGAEWIRTEISGPFEVTPDVRSAYAVWTQHRERLEAIELYQMIRAHIRGN